MIGIDTNVLLRAYIDDPSSPEQVSAARALLTEKGGEGVWISLPVLLETVWIIRRRFANGRSVIIRFLADLLDRKLFVLQERGAVEAALESYSTARVGYADCLIMALAKERDVTTTYTFDAAAADLVHFTLVETGT